jgi:hypothetical protein
MSEVVRDECRFEIAADGLTPTAVTHLTRDALGTIDLDNLATVKTLLKRFFSAERWTVADDDALAAVVGPGEGWWRQELDDRFVFEYGWRAGSFCLALSWMGGDPQPDPQHDTPNTARSEDPPDLAATFEGPVVPEATPNPRTIRFVTPPIHDGPSRWYASATDVDDPRVARLFAAFAEVANVLVGPDFVAIGLRRPDAWEQLLDPMLRVVTAEFAPTTVHAAEPSAAEVAVRDRPSNAHSSSEARPHTLDRAWRELGALQPDRPHDLERLVAAVSATEPAERQVAARVMIRADAQTAETAWGRLLDDPSRVVRRATVDAMVDAQRPALRALLELALDDTDAWTRWKALRGLVELGLEPSRARLTALSGEPDFRVRLELARALRAPHG